jgi:hypothetical protein
MSTTTTQIQTVPRPTRQARLQKRFLRRRQRLAAILERALEPRYPLRHGLQPWPRIPSANRHVVFEPLAKVAILLRDPSVAIPERTLRNVLAFVTDPASAIYGEYPTQASFRAHSLIDEIRGHGAGAAA